MKKVADDLHPIKSFKFNKPKPPYLNNQLLNQMKNRDYFYKKAKKLGNVDDWNIAKFLRNQTNKNIKRAKADYIIEQLRNAKNDSAKFWRTIKQTFPTDKDRDHSVIRLKHLGTNIQEDETANYINEFFINVGNTVIANSVSPPRDTNQTAQISSPLTETNQAEVYRLTKMLNTSKSSGLPNLSTRFVKDALLTLNEQFTHLVNVSLREETIPSQWKKATVVPIPKVGNPQEVTNYRPISLLPTPGKIMEKIVHDQMTHYLEDNGLLTEDQFGFRRGRSTTLAITQLLNSIHTGLNRKMSTVALFVDFKKAFDCLQYGILYTKLEKLGLPSGTMNWIKDYLREREQSTLANGCRSDYAKIKQGVPQGSIVGPLLFIIYANDISSIIKKSKSVYYADDTVIYSQSKDIHKAMRTVRANLQNLNTWCAKNGIYINPKKTKFIVFSNNTKKTKKALPKLKLEVNSTEVERVKSFNYLGVKLDDKLTFDQHVKSLISRVSAKLFQLKKIRSNLTAKAATLVYKNMILPIMEYGDIYLYSASKSNRKKLQTLQNKALRCAIGRDSTYNTSMLHKEAKLQKLKIRRRTHLLLHMFQLSQLQNFKGWKPKSRIRTRSSYKKSMLLKKPNTVRYQNSIAYIGPKSWNALPIDIQRSDNYYQFKQRVMTHHKMKEKEKEKDQLSV